MKKAGAFVVSFGLALAASGCPGGDDGPGGSGGGAGGEPSEPAWRVVFDDGELDRAVLSVWGTSSTSLYVVGGALGNGGEALALHFDGTRWKDLQPHGLSSFWWVHGTSDTDVWMVGENGRIAHWDGAAFTEHPSGVTATLWGVMAFSPDDAWAVGGMPGGSSTGPDDVVLHFDGTAWAEVALPGAPLDRALYKVWGASSSDLFVVGEAGAIWHRQGTTWVLRSEMPVATGNLTTVHGCSPTDVWAVGGRDLLHFDGSAWTRLDRTLTNDVNGVHCGGGGVGIVGFGGLKQRFDGATWADEFSSDPHGDLHAVWRDDTGAYWAVGGGFINSKMPGAPRNGIVTRYGPGSVPDTLE